MIAYSDKRELVPLDVNTANQLQPLSYDKIEYTQSILLV